MLLNNIKSDIEDEKEEELVYKLSIQGKKVRKIL